MNLDRSSPRRACGRASQRAKPGQLNYASSGTGGGAHLAAESSEVGGMPPGQFAQYVANEIAKWRRVVKEANIKAV